MKTHLLIQRESELAKSHMKLVCAACKTRDRPLGASSFNAHEAKAQDLLHIRKVQFGRDVKETKLEDRLQKEISILLKGLVLEHEVIIVIYMDFSFARVRVAEIGPTLAVQGNILEDLVVNAHVQVVWEGLHENANVREDFVGVVVVNLEKDLGIDG